jgi:hypothetical protein
MLEVQEGAQGVGDGDVGAGPGEWLTCVDTGCALLGRDRCVLASADAWPSPLAALPAGRMPTRCGSPSCGRDQTLVAIACHTTCRPGSYSCRGPKQWQTRVAGRHAAHAAAVSKPAAEGARLHTSAVKYNVARLIGLPTTRISKCKAEAPTTALFRAALTRDCIDTG